MKRGKKKLTCPNFKKTGELLAARKPAKTASSLFSDAAK
jgi:hypothetical protein